MKTNFYKIQKNIKDYITNEYPKLTKELFNLDPLDKSVMSFPNLDRERKNKILYFDYDKYTFESLTLESYLLKVWLDLYVTLRGSARPEIMAEQMAKYATVFFTLLNQDETLDNIVDSAIIEEIELFEHVEGNTNYKIAKLRIKIEKECA